jgi:hypothetical protein
VTEENCEIWWGLRKRENGDVWDVHDGGIYGDKYVVYGRMVDGAVEFEENLDE